MKNPSVTTLKKKLTTKACDILQKMGNSLNCLEYIHEPCPGWWKQVKKKLTKKVCDILQKKGNSLNCLEYSHEPCPGCVETSKLVTIFNILQTFII